MMSEAKQYIEEKFNRVFDRLEAIEKAQNDLYCKLNKLEQRNFKQYALYIGLTVAYGFILYVIK